MNNPPRPALLTTAFYAFYDLHRPTYHAYASARLTPEEAAIAVAQLFGLIADNWTTVVNAPSPSAWAWTRHTRAIARRGGHPHTPAEDADLLHRTLHLSIDKIATVTGTEAATVVALLASRRRRADPAADQEHAPTPIAAASHAPEGGAAGPRLGRRSSTGSPLG
ncbi:hypothetical protein [Streptomyces sp. NPDC057695]|uniref:hypothetical protein n=1 Tax=Streptomyces sp. NPDC057695 TaxID=3346217 RepID=UPI0036B42405